MMYIIFSLIWAIIWGYATYKVIDLKGYKEKNWFLYGFLFGIIAFIIALKKPIICGDKEEAEKQNPGDWKCEFCRRVNSSDRNICFCGKTKRDTIEEYSKKWRSKNNIYQ